MFLSYFKDSRHKPQIIFLMFAAFFANVGYPFTRTSAAPYFNEAYGSAYLSWAMVSAAILAVIVVTIYNRLAKRYELLRLTLGMVLAMIAITLGFGLVMGHHPKWMALLFYAWSDVYMLIMVEQFWSISNTIFDKNIAKKYYGLFLSAGSFGGLVGNAFMSQLVIPFGAGRMIFVCAFFMTVFFLAIYLLKRSIDKDKEIKAQFKIEHYLADTSGLGGATLVFKSRYITLIALLVLTTQLYINGTYFIFNSALDSAVHLVDAQSALYGKAFLIIQMVTLFTAVVLTPLAMRFLGVGRTHYSVVGLIAVLLAAAIISPHLIFVAILFIFAKSFDYSIFRAAKEMFYIPLHVAEKFQAKSFIDIFLYRFSKAFAALGIIVVGQFLGLSIFWLVGAAILLWLVLIILLVKRYEANHIEN